MSWRRLVVGLMLGGVLAHISTVPAAEAGVPEVDHEGTRLAPATDPYRFGDDPLRLVVDEEAVRRFAASPDVFEVWLCHNPGSEMPFDLDHALAVLDADIGGYFEWLSGGLYRPTFVAGGTVVVVGAISGVNPYACLPAVEAGATGAANAAFIVVGEGLTVAGGRAQVPALCFGEGCPTSFPEDERWAAVGDGAFVALGGPVPSLATSAHEIGHTQHWPHSSSGVSESEYDNPMDVMSGNARPGGVPELLPFATPAFNRYRAGWIAPGDVVLFTGGVVDVTLAPIGVAGTQMVVLPLRNEPGSFVTLGARVSAPGDPIPTAWEGVDAYFVDQVCDGVPCGGLSSSMTPYPAEPDEVVNVTGAGGVLDFELLDDRIAAGRARLEVLDRSAAGFSIRLIGFTDVIDTVFREDIFWLAEEGITRGCGGGAYCARDGITRGQLAAMLVRALELTDRGTVDFVDDDGSIFEADIEKLAAAGITRGCNPPVNDRFCPRDRLTREQVAALLRRALA